MPLLSQFAHTCYEKALSRGGTEDNDNGWAQIQAYRRLQYNRMQRQLAELQKNAGFKSGARGSDARKELLYFEKRVVEAKERYEWRNFNGGNPSVG